MAGHTWVLLATEIRRHSDKGPQHFRIHRPNNVAAADMQEGGLMQVCMSYVKLTWWLRHICCLCVVTFSIPSDLRFACHGLSCHWHHAHAELVVSC